MMNNKQKIRNSAIADSKSKSIHDSGQKSNAQKLHSNTEKNLYLYKECGSCNKSMEGAEEHPGCSKIEDDQNVVNQAIPKEAGYGRISSLRTHEYNQSANNEDVQSDSVSHCGPVKKIMNDLNEIQKSIEAGYEVIRENNEKAVLVIGKTGAGKSSLVNYLIRPQEIRGIKKETSGDKLIVDAEQQTGCPKIGHGRDGETRIPNKCYDHDNDVTYWDFPGFDYNGGPVKDIPNAFFIKRVFEKTKNIKIILVIDSKDLECRARELKSIVDNLTNLFGSFAKIEEAVSLIVTKVAHGKKVNDVISELWRILRSECFIDNPSSGKELLNKLLNSGTAKEHKTEVMTKSKISLFKKPKKEGHIGLDDYYEIMEIVNTTQFVPTPQVNVTVSQESMLYAIDLGYGVKKNLINHFDELRKKVINFCFIPSNSVEKMSLIELNSLIEELLKIKPVLQFVAHGDRVDQLKSSVLAYVDKIINTLPKRETSLDVTELLNEIQRDSNCFTFLVSINKEVELICNPLELIKSRMNDGKLEIADNLKLITAQVQAHINTENAAINTFVSIIEGKLCRCIQEEDELENTQFENCQESFDTIQYLNRICTKVTDPDSSFKVIIDTLENGLIKKYGLEVPQRATDAIRIYANLSLIDAGESCAYKKILQCELKKMFEYIEKLYRNKVVPIHAKSIKDISRSIKDFCSKFHEWLEEVKEHDKEGILKHIKTIAENFAESENSPYKMIGNLYNMLETIGINDSVLSCLKQLKTNLKNCEKLAKRFDNLQSYPCQKFVKMLKKLYLQPSTYGKLDQDSNIESKVENDTRISFAEVQNYMLMKNSLDSIVERLQKIHGELNSMTNNYKNVKETGFNKNPPTTTHSADHILTTHPSCVEVESISNIIIDNLAILKTTITDDEYWHQGTLPKIISRSNDLNFELHLTVENVNQGQAVIFDSNGRKCC